MPHGSRAEIHWICVTSTERNLAPLPQIAIIFKDLLHALEFMLEDFLPRLSHSSGHHSTAANSLTLRNSWLIRDAHVANRCGFSQREQLIDGKKQLGKRFCLFNNIVSEVDIQHTAWHFLSNDLNT